MKDGDLYRVHFRMHGSVGVCGVIVREGRIVETAPLVRWAHGKPLAVLIGWVTRHGGSVERIG